MKYSFDMDNLKRKKMQDKVIMTKADSFSSKTGRFFLSLLEEDIRMKLFLK